MLLYFWVRRYNIYLINLIILFLASKSERRKENRNEIKLGMWGKWNRILKQISPFKNKVTYVCDILLPYILEV